MTLGAGGAVAQDADEGVFHTTAGPLTSDQFGDVLAHQHMFVEYGARPPSLTCSWPRSAPAMMRFGFRVTLGLAEHGNKGDPMVPPGLSDVPAGALKM